MVEQQPFNLKVTGSSPVWGTMNVSEFRLKIEPNIILSIDDKDFIVKKVVKFRFDNNDFYIKCFLNDDYVFADDLDQNTFILAKEVKTPFKDYPQEINFENKKFKFLYTAHATAEEIQGEEIFKKGDSESFWDYKAEDNFYLSLGVVDSTKERLDFYGKILDNDSITLK